MVDHNEILCVRAADGGARLVLVIQAARQTEHFIDQRKLARMVTERDCLGDPIFYEPLRTRKVIFGKEGLELFNHAANGDACGGLLYFFAGGAVKLRTENFGIVFGSHGFLRGLVFA